MGTAELMVQSSPEVVSCFIHEVQPISRTLTSLQAPDRRAWEAKRIFFFCTYVGAATAAFKEQIIGVEELAEMVVEAVDDYRVEMHKHGLRHSQARARSSSPGVSLLFNDLVADATIANDILKTYGLPEVELPDASGVFSWEDSATCDSYDNESDDDADDVPCQKKESTRSIAEHHPEGGFHLPSLVGADASADAVKKPTAGATVFGVQSKK